MTWTNCSSDLVGRPVKLSSGQDLARGIRVMFDSGLLLLRVLSLTFLALILMLIGSLIHLSTRIETGYNPSPTVRLDCLSWRLLRQHVFFILRFF